MRVQAPAPANAITTQVFDGYQLCARCGKVLVKDERAVVVPRAPFWLIHTHEIGPNCPAKAVRGWKAVKASEAIRNLKNETMPREAEPFHLSGLVVPSVCLLDDKHIEAELALVDYAPSDEIPADSEDVRELLSRFVVGMSGGRKRAVAKASLDDVCRGRWQSVVRNAVEDDLVAAIDEDTLDSKTNTETEIIWECRRKSYATGALAPATRPFPHAFVHLRAQSEVSDQPGRRTRSLRALSDVLTWDEKGRAGEYALYSKRKVFKIEGKWMSELEAWGPKPKPIGLPYNSKANPDLYTWHQPPQSKRKPLRHWPMSESQAPYGPVAVLKPEVLARLNAQRNEHFRGENIEWMAAGANPPAEQAHRAYTTSSGAAP